MIAVQQTDEIEIFMNDAGGISMRQRNSMGEDDAIISFWPDNVQSIIDGLEAATRDIVFSAACAATEKSDVA